VASSGRGRRAGLLCVALAAGFPAAAPAQGLRFAGGRVALAGEATLTYGPEDRYFFNYTDYEYSALRLARLELGAAWRPVRRLEVLADVRSDNLDHPRLHALFVRLRPFPERPFDLQAGRIPPAFGAFGRRRYGADNPLIGYPLAYQYLTSLRSDAVPTSAVDLLRMRGRGWRSSFGIGAPPAPGFPLVSAVRWDTGVQARIGSEPVDLVAAVTTGTLSSPRIRDDNDGRQVSGRVTLRPWVGLVFGASAAHGPYLATEVVTLVPGASRATANQTAFGVDVEYSRAYWLARAEAVWSAWELLPTSDPLLPASVRSRAFMIEGRYKVRPGLFAAARYDHLGFSRVAGVPWDTPVWRVEAGAGLSLRRDLVLKAVYQHSRREGTPTRLRAFAGQLLAWF
jgi:hypothetical protein